MVVEINLLDTEKDFYCDFSVILPVYNESESLSIVCESLLNVINSRRDATVEVIFVDDASNDNSIQVIQSFNWETCRIFRHLVNLGHQQSLLTGLALARGRYIGMMDSDGQHPLMALFEMFDLASQHNFDCVQGVRNSRSTDGHIKKLTAFFFYRFMRLISTDDFAKNAADFRVISSRCARILLASMKPIPFRFSLASLNIKRMQYDFTVAPRFAGKSKYSFRKMNSLAIASITNFSDKPLRFAALLGIISSAFSLLLLLTIIAVALIGKTVPGWASLATLISIFGALILLSIGIVALYLSKASEQGSSLTRDVELVRDFKA